MQWDRVVQGNQLNILKAWGLQSQIENYQSSKNNLRPRLVVGLEKEICRGSWRRRRRLRLWTSLCTRQGSQCQCPGGNRIDMKSQYQISTYVKNMISLEYLVNYVLHHIWRHLNGANVVQGGFVILTKSFANCWVVRACVCLLFFIVILILSDSCQVIITTYQ